MELIISIMILLFIFGILILGPAWLIYKKNKIINIEKNKKALENFRCGFTFYDECSTSPNKCCANIELYWPFTRITLYDNFFIIKNILKTIVLKYSDIKDIKSQFNFSVIIDTDKSKCPQRLTLTTYKNSQKLMDMLKAQMST